MFTWSSRWTSAYRRLKCSELVPNGSGFCYNRWFSLFVGLTTGSFDHGDTSNQNPWRTYQLWTFVLELVSKNLAQLQFRILVFKSCCYCHIPFWLAYAKIKGNIPYENGTYASAIFGNKIQRSISYIFLSIFPETRWVIVPRFGFCFQSIRVSIKINVMFHKLWMWCNCIGIICWTSKRRVIQCTSF